MRDFRSIRVFRASVILADIELFQVDDDREWLATLEPAEVDEAIARIEDPAKQKAAPGIVADMVIARAATLMAMPRIDKPEEEWISSLDPTTRAAAAKLAQKRRP